MGIPWYFKAIVNKHPDITCGIPKECDRLFLDFNSVIHTAAAEVVELNPDNLEEAIFEKIIAKTEEITKTCMPRKMLYIAVDGVAPVAKQVQQRKRRYLSAFRNGVINEYKNRNNILYNGWDSNCITPGTSFMYKLDAFLKNHYEETETSYKIVFSGHLEEGEGEQKIIKYIRQNPGPGNIIYGMDADLIMLGLLSKQNIILLRDKTCLDLKKLYEAIASHDVNINDYIFLCFLLGNDFLPGIQFLKLRDGALDVISDIYKQENIRPIITENDNKFKVRTEGLVNLIEGLAKHEDESMKEVTNKYYNANIDKNRRSFKTKLEKFIYELDNYPIINKFAEYLINPISNQKWRQEYYFHLFGSNSIPNVNQVVKNYIEGLLWTTNYYFNMEYDVGWHYKYNYAPCVADIQRCIYACEIENMLDSLKKSKISLSIPHQLLTVIPIASIRVLPDALKPMLTDINNNCAHYYPLRFCLGTYLKYALHECVPIIPNINFNHIYEEYERYQKQYA